ncbi:hypothetical protein ONZ45_g10970 [Pleurotus djamor]|nr:hypothetical protein ONZ45_g10970 [Pleurotus djamor]
MDLFMILVRMKFLVNWLLALSCALWVSAFSVEIPDFLFKRELDALPQGNTTKMALSTIGFTQDSIASEVHVHNAGEFTKTAIKTFLEEAKKQPGEKETYLNSKFPDKIQVFYHDTMKKYLSIDNRRLCIFKEILGKDAKIDVVVYTLADIKTVLKGEANYKKRVSTKNDGVTIQVRGKDKWTCPTP